MPSQGDAAGLRDLQVGWQVRAALLVALAALAGAADTAYASEGAGPHRNQESPAKAVAKQLVPDPKPDIAGKIWEATVESNCENPSSPNCDTARQQDNLVEILSSIVVIAGVIWTLVVIIKKVQVIR